MGAAGDLQVRNITAWNEHDEAGWTGTYSRQTRFTGPGGAGGSGPEGAAAFFHAWTDSFPDNQCKVLRVVDGGDCAIWEGVFEGTHTGALNTPSGAIPATGKRVALPFVVVNGFSAGQFTDFALYFDVQGMLVQLGLT